MYISAKVDYAVRAMCSLAQAGDRPLSVDAIARSQQLPAKYLEAILADLRRAGLVRSQRGAEGGYRLTRDPAGISIADIVRPLDGPLAEVRGLRPEAAGYEGPAAGLRDVWIAVRGALREVLEGVSVADLASGQLPPAVTSRTADPDAWRSRPTRPGMPPA